MPDVKIFAGQNCGWAVRNYIALIEKRVPFENVSAVDQAGRKTDEFLRATPYGLSPVLMHGNTSVFESTLINEYIDDQFPEPPLMPSDPTGRSEARKWIHYCENSLMPALVQGANQGQEKNRKNAIMEFRERAAWFAKHVLGSTWRGPYFFGAQFTLLDIAFHTLFDTARKFGGSDEEGAALSDPALVVWRSNIDSRPSIRKARDYREQLPS